MTVEPYDCTGKIGALYPTTQPPEWPMYSFDQPSMIVWNALADKLHEQGWSDKKIKDWLQSKSPRWALDSELGDALQAVARAYASTLA